MPGYRIHNAMSLTPAPTNHNNLDILLLEEAEGFSNFIQKSLKTEPLVFICHKNHPLTYLETVTAHDLIKEPLLLREKASPLRNSIDYYFSKFGLNPQPLWESMDYSVLINAVSNRIGISVVPLSIYYATLNDTITKLNVPDFDIKRTLNVFFHKDKTFSPMLNEFLEFCKIVI